MDTNISTSQQVLTQTNSNGTDGIINGENNLEKDKNSAIADVSEKEKVMICESLDSILARVSSTGRVKFHCLDASKHFAFIVFGANSGSIYFYEKETSKFIALLSPKEIRESISIIKVSPNPNANYVGLSTLKNTIAIVEYNLNKKEKDRTIVKVQSKDDITALQWDEHGFNLFVGDSLGNIFIVNPNTNTSGSSPVKLECIYKCDTTVVQFDWSEGHLLASSLTRTVLINLIKQSFCQVGTQLRDGRFGGCFVRRQVGEKERVVLASRPGKRIWVAEYITGAVKQTLNFKDSLSLMPQPSNVTNNPYSYTVDNAATSMKNANFSKLATVRIEPELQGSSLDVELLVAWDTNAIFIIDLIRIQILEWFVDLMDISDLCVSGSSIFVIHGTNKNLAKLSISKAFCQNHTVQPKHEESSSLPTTTPAPEEITANVNISDVTVTRSAAISVNGSQIDEYPQAVSSSSNMGSVGSEASKEVDSRGQSRSPSQGLSASAESGRSGSSSPSTSLSVSPATSQSPSSTTPTPSTSGNVYIDNTYEAFPEPTIAVAPTSGTPKPKKTPKSPPEVSQTEPVAEVTPLAQPVRKKKTKKVKTKVPAILSPVPAPSTIPLMRSNTVANLQQFNPSKSLPPGQTNHLHSSASDLTQYQIKRSNSTLEDLGSARDDHSTGSSLSSSPDHSNVSSPVVEPLQPSRGSKKEKNPLKFFGETVEKLAKNKTALPAFDNFKNFLKDVNINTTTVDTTLGKISSAFNISLGPDNDTANTFSKLDIDDTSDNQSIHPIPNDNTSSPLYQLTKITYEALTSFRREKDRTSGSLLSLLEHWHSSFSQVNLEETPVSSIAPSSWIIEILTTLFELKSPKSTLTVEMFPEDETNTTSSIRSENLWQEVAAKEYISKYYKYLHMPRISFAVNQSHFVECLATLLELFDQHDEEVDNQESSAPNSKSLPSVSKTIAKYLENQDGLSALNVIKKSNNLLLTLKYLGTIFQMAPEATGDYCALSYPAVLPWNVASHVGNQIPVYLHYITQLFSFHAQCKQDSVMVETWFELNLLDGAPSAGDLYHSEEPVDVSLKTEGSSENQSKTFGVKAPKRNAHKLAWRHGTTLMMVIDNPHHHYQYNPLRLKMLCDTYGFFAGLTKLYIKSNQTRKAIDLILQLDDYDSFKILMSSNFDIYDWKYTLSLMEKVEDKERNINKENIIRLMITCLGALPSLELVMQMPQFSNDVPAPVYNAFISKGKIEMEQQQLASEILESMDTYLWSQRPTVVPPQLQSFLTCETTRRLEALPFMNKTKQKDKYEFGFDSNTQLPRYCEDMGVHWGISVSAERARCPVCTLSVAEKVGGSSDIAVFPCGHTFHKFCLSKTQDACNVCLSSNFKSLLERK